PDARDGSHGGVVGRLGFARRDDLFAPVVPAARADAVREPGGAAVRAVRQARLSELPVRAPLLAARMRMTSLGNRHDAEPPGRRIGARSVAAMSGRTRRAPGTARRHTSGTSPDSPPGNGE